MKLCLFSFAIAASLALVQGDSCAFLSADDGPPFTFELPSMVLAHPLSDLPMEFRGISPIVTRAPLKAGQMPKVTITRYSSKPEIFYDETENRVVVTSSSCSSDDTTVSRSNGDDLELEAEGNGDSVSKAEEAAMAVSSAMSSNYMIVAVSTLLAAVTQSPFVTGAFLAMGLANGIHAQEDCEPVVEILVEAPAGFKGAREVCLEEINDPAICPDPFPTYPTCSEATPTCEIAVVGGGAGGLYTALRMVDEGKVAASDVCVFEMTERVGGRLMSLRGLGPEDDLVVDAGGYRTWPEFTPTAHALITEYLGIPMGCYDDSDPCHVYNIVGEDGKKAGFTQFVEEMMQRLSDGGACFFPYHELKSLERLDAPGDGDLNPTKLYFANGVVAMANVATILNMPQRPLLNVVRESNMDAAGMLDAETLDALHSVQTVIATKLYLYYPRGHVFWHKLGLFSGDFESDGDARSMLLAGRYHDGQVQCDDEDDVDTCHGFLLAVYANDLSGNKAQYFRRFQRDRPEPVTIISNQDLEGRVFLEHAHDRLMNYHVYEKMDAPYTGFQASQILPDIQPPTFAVLSTWNTAIPWAGGAWHGWTETDNIDLAKQPFVDDDIFVVNEAFSLMHGWAEGSLKVADEILEDHFGIARPWNFTANDLNQIVRQTNSQECQTAPVAVSTAAVGGGGDDSAAALLCFTADALVEMADGSRKPISEVRVGDVVAPGPEGGEGIVTETLVHPVDRTVEVATLKTDQGTLVGTSDHPVFHEKEWMEFSQLPHKDLLLETRHVEAFYNLEIDGHLLEESMHAYVVNGVVASGLGDNEELNLRFPRQNLWKARAANKEEKVAEMAEQ